MEKNKIINGFCFLKNDDVVFVDLVTEKTEKYKKDYFKKFIEEYEIDDTYIVLSNREDGVVSLLYKYKLSNKNNKDIKATNKKIDELIDVCYKICIESFQKSKDKLL
jgi:hypothetical protein